MNTITSEQWKKLQNAGWHGSQDVYAYFPVEGHGYRDKARYESPLSFALKHVPELIMPLIQAGAPIEVNTRFPLAGHLSPLMIAVNYQRHEAVRWMLNQQVNINHISERKFTVFHSLLENSTQIELFLPTLLSQGVDLFIPDPRNEKRKSNYLHAAILSGSYEAVSLLLKTNPYLANTSNQNGDSPLVLVMACDVEQDSKIIDELIKYQANLNFLTKDGETPIGVSLYGFSTQKTLEKIKKLVEAGADMNQPNQDGMTPLMLACDEHPEIALYLLDKGANPNLVDKHGNNFWTLCEKHNPQLYQEAMELISLKDKEHLKQTLNTSQNPLKNSFKNHL